MAVAVQEHKSLTLILARGFASNLSVPISVHDPTGRVVFYNDAAEVFFGMPFEQMGELSAEEWTARFLPGEADGTPIPLEELPVGMALSRRRPAHRPVHFTRPDGLRYGVEVTAFPLVGREEELFGAVRIFWNDAVASTLAATGPRASTPSGEAGRPPRGRPKSLVLLLAREFAANLAAPIYLTDGDATLIYFNEPAERIGGRSFAESGEMSIPQWAELLKPRGVDGSYLPLAEMPGGIAFIERRPTHGRLRITGLDGVEREIALTAFPLLGRDTDFHGVMVIFWEHDGGNHGLSTGEPMVPP